VTPGGGHFQGALDVLLPFDLAEVQVVRTALVQQRGGVRRQRRLGVEIVQQDDHIGQRADGVDLDIADDGCLAGVGFGNDQEGALVRPRLDRH
jgi:hypothetical protein